MRSLLPSCGLPAAIPSRVKCSTAAPIALTRTATNSNGSRRDSSIRTRRGSPPGAVSCVQPYADSIFPPAAITRDSRKTGIASCTYCSACSPPIGAGSEDSTSSSANLAPSSRRSDSGPKPTTVTFAPSTMRVLSTSAPHPSLQNCTASRMSSTGTRSRWRKRVEPARTCSRVEATNLVFCSSCRMSYSSCAFSPNA